MREETEDLGTKRTLTPTLWSNCMREKKILLKDQWSESRVLWLLQKVEGSLRSEGICQSQLWPFYLGHVLPAFDAQHEPPGGCGKAFLIQEIWAGAQDAAFLTSSHAAGPQTTFGAGVLGHSQQKSHIYQCAWRMGQALPEACACTTCPI